MERGCHKLVDLLFVFFKPMGNVILTNISYEIQSLNLVTLNIYRKIKTESNIVEKSGLSVLKYKIQQIEGSFEADLRQIEENFGRLKSKNYFSPLDANFNSFDANVYFLSKVHILEPRQLGPDFPRFGKNRFGTSTPLFSEFW